jgi:hypothetical protein
MENNPENVNDIKPENVFAEIKKRMKIIFFI